MTPISAQAPLALNLLGYPPILGGPSLAVRTQAKVEVVIYPLEQEEFAFRLPDHDEVIRFETKGCRQLLRQRATRESLRLFLSDSAAPRWAQRALLHLYQFCREQRWQPPSGLLVDFQTELPDGFGLDIEAAWLTAMEKALVLLMGTGKNTVRSKKKSTPAPNRTQIEEINYARASAPMFWNLHPELLALAWIADQGDSGAEAVPERFSLATRMGQVVLEKSLRCNWPTPSALTFSIVHREAKDSLPRTITGREFQQRYPTSFIGHDSIEEQTEYPLHAALDHLLLENQRCSAASLLLRSSPRQLDEEAARLIGQYLVQSHEERGGLGWKSPEADQIIDTLLELGPKRGLYGARLIERGENGFAVMVLFHRRAWRALKSLRHQVYFSTEGPWPFIV